MAKFYCVYMAYSKHEVMDKSDKEFDKLPTYPRNCARVRIFNNALAQLEAYANTRCPASQVFEADSEEEIDQKIKEFNDKFEDEEWLEENIYPYI